MSDDYVHLLIKRPSDTAALSGGSWVGSLPLTNIQDFDVAKVARSTNALNASTRFRLDAGVGLRQAWQDFCVINHNLSKNALIRFVATDDPNNADINLRYGDTGLVPAWLATVPFGSKPWGTFPWDGIDEADYPRGPLIYYRYDAAVYARYLWVYIQDEANPAGYVDIGLFMGGVSWFPKVNVEYGFGLRNVDPSEVRRSLGARRFAEKLETYREVTMTFQHLSEADAYGILFDWQKLGRQHPVLFVANPNDPPAIRFRRTMLCGLGEIQPIVHESFGIHTYRVTLEEMP